MYDAWLSAERIADIQHDATGLDGRHKDGKPMLSSGGSPP
jgi:hypothetical protein